MAAQKRQYLVIGLGEFGSSAARTLAAAGNEVLGVDIDPALVDENADFLTHALQMDATDENALRALGARNFDTAIISIGESVQASALVVMMIKEMGVPYVCAKAGSELHGRLLTRVGADQVIFPEREMGERLAQSLMNSLIADFIGLSGDWAVHELRVPDEWVCHPLSDLHLQERYGISIIAIKRLDEMVAALTGRDVLREGDRLIVIGRLKDVKRLDAMERG